MPVAHFEHRLDALSASGAEAVCPDFVGGEFGVARSAGFALDMQLIRGEGLVRLSHQSDGLCV